MHTLEFLRRRFPTSYPMMVMLIGLILFGLLIVGIGMLFVR